MRDTVLYFPRSLTEIHGNVPTIRGVSQWSTGPGMVSFMGASTHAQASAPPWHARSPPQQDFRVVPVLLGSVAGWVGACGVSVCFRRAVSDPVAYLSISGVQAPTR
jgi:hypothetical protein